MAMELEKNGVNLFFLLSKAQKILLVTHENPDGDAISSLGICYDFLINSQKRTISFCKNLSGKHFDFLPYVEKIIDDKNEIDFTSFDIAIILDCANLKRTGIDSELKSLQCPIINIDHHISNNNFGYLNIIDAQAVSTTQILYELFKTTGVKITKNMANCILTGIVTDSGNFAYTASSSQTFGIAGEMLMRGANVRDIINYTNKNKKLSTLKIWGLALSRLVYNKRYDIAYTVLTNEDLMEFGVVKDDLEGLSNFLNTLKDAKIVMVLYELNDGRIKGSFRTTYANVDVSKLALRLGGGGHAKAAGFDVVGKLVYVDDKWQII